MERLATSDVSSHRTQTDQSTQTGEHEWTFPVSSTHRRRPFAGLALIFLSGFYGEQARILELELGSIDGRCF
jgi:hypothetical protein